MKNILSILSGRLTSMLFPFVMVVSFLFPTSVMASIEYSLFGDGGTGLLEGDPLDTNDVGSGNGGGLNHVDKSNTNLIPNPFGFKLGRSQILLIPESVGGILIFKIMVVEKPALGMMDLSPEGIHAQ